MTQTIINLGTGGAVLNGRNGSTAGADSNDALFLDWDGLDYVYLPGVGGNQMNVPSQSAFNFTTDIDVRVHVAADIYAQASTLVSRQAVTRVFRLNINSAKTFTFAWWPDGGATTLSATSTTGLSTVDGEAVWVRVTLDVNNGASQYDVKFFTSIDGVSWTQLGATVTGSTGVTQLATGTVDVEIGSQFGSSNPFTGKFYRAQIFNGIDGTKVLDVDTSVITSGAATTFTALTGQTVTINRSTAGRKAVAVVSPVWLFGTDDYMEVVDNSLLDYSATDSFTLVAIVRQWATQPASSNIVNKLDNSSLNGWSLFVDSSARTTVVMNAGSFLATPVSASVTAGTVGVIGAIRDAGAGSLRAFANSVLGTADTTIRPSVSNAQSLRIGVDRSGLAPLNGELIAVAIFRRVLSAAEISAIISYYQARLS